VASGPTGLAYDRRKDRLAVWSAFDRVLTVLYPTRSSMFDVISPWGPREPTPFEAGRKLFHAAGDMRVSRDGRACASCHPDGRDDGLVWTTPDGTRQTPTLAGRLDGAEPFGWSGESRTVEEHVVKRTIARLKGRGLSDDSTYALLSYLKGMPAPARARGDSDEVRRGAAIFRSREAGCASCHWGHALTDGERHDVQSKNPVDLTGDFDTPSLRLVAGTAPYFHDGRYASLTELLRSTDGSMGNTGQLSDAELRDLVAYLETL
jgi:cytochrome c peroxidase